MPGLPFVSDQRIRRGVVRQWTMPNRPSDPVRSPPPPPPTYRTKNRDRQTDADDRQTWWPTTTADRICGRDGQVGKPARRAHRIVIVPRPRDPRENAHGRSRRPASHGYHGQRCRPAVACAYAVAIAGPALVTDRPAGLEPSSRVVIAWSRTNNWTLLPGSTRRVDTVHAGCRRRAEDPHGYDISSSETPR